MIVAHIGKSLPWGVGSNVYNMCKYFKDFRPIIIVSASNNKDAQIKSLGVPFFLAKNDAVLMKLLQRADIIDLHCFDNDLQMYEKLNTSGKPIAVSLHTSARLPRIPSRIICQTNWVKEMQDPANDCAVIGNGVDLERFHPVQKQQKRKKVIIARICRGTKCDEFFWPAAIEVLNERKNTELWLIGEPGESTERIKMLGFQTDLPAILSKVDIVVHTPAPKAAAKDLVVMEVMAMGIPAIYSKVEGVKASINREYGSLFVTPGDSGALKKKLLFLVDNPDIRCEIGRIAAKIATEKFDVKYMVKQYENTYRMVISCKKMDA